MSGNEENKSKDATGEQKTSKKKEEEKPMPPTTCSPAPKHQQCVLAKPGLQKQEELNGTSIRMLPKMDSNELEGPTGEALKECTDAEWLAGEKAYPSELLEVKKRRNKVTVFVASSGSANRTRTLRTPRVSGEEPKKNDVDAVAVLVSKITKAFLEDKDTEGVEVEVTMRVGKGAKQQNLAE